MTRPDQTRPDQTAIHAQKSCVGETLLVTLYDSAGNYGNALQHYALQEILRGLGFNVDSLVCPLVKHSESREAQTEPLHIRLLRQIQAQNDPLRRKLFEAFYRKFIPSITYSTYSDVLQSDKAVWSQYNYVVVGSDQVWNRNLLGSDEALTFHYLPFVEQEKRVNYAPSFGVREFQPSEVSTHQKGLEGFSMLSCREKNGCELIRKITGREAQHVLDPTLLLNAEYWRRISRKPSYDVPEHYALLYAFGVFPEEIMPVIIELTGGLPVINIRNVKDAEYFCTGPEEFIWLIDNTDYVFTNSFHGTAFSVNFRKKFLSVIGQNEKWFDSYGVRIESLLSVLGIMDNVFYGLDKNFPSMLVNYDDVHEKLNVLRESSMKYLRECLK